MQSIRHGQTEPAAFLCIWWKACEVEREREVGEMGARLTEPNMAAPQRDGSIAPGLPLRIGDDARVFSIITSCT